MNFFQKIFAASCSAWKTGQKETQVIKMWGSVKIWEKNCKQDNKKPENIRVCAKNGLFLYVDESFLYMCLYISCSRDQGLHDEWSTSSHFDSYKELYSFYWLISCFQRLICLLQRWGPKPPVWRFFSKFFAGSFSAWKTGQKSLERTDGHVSARLISRYKKVCLWCFLIAQLIF